MMMLESVVRGGMCPFNLFYLQLTNTNQETIGFIFRFLGEEMGTKRHRTEIGYRSLVYLGLHDRIESSVMILSHPRREIHCKNVNDNWLINIEKMLAVLAPVRQTAFLHDLRHADASSTAHVDHLRTALASWSTCIWTQRHQKVACPGRGAECINAQYDQRGGVALYHLAFHTPYVCALEQQGGPRRSGSSWDGA
jgi:hypothetical protein